MLSIYFTESSNHINIIIIAVIEEVDGSLSFLEYFLNDATLLKLDDFCNIFIAF